MKKAAVTLAWENKRPPAKVEDEIFVPWETFDAPSAGALRQGRLFQGDNADALRHLLGRDERAHLIYIDPPYAMQATHGVQVGHGEEAMAYADAWADADYCQFMFERLVLMHQLLHDDGMIFVHCDWRASAWLRLLLEEVFGRGHFRNEIVWRRAPNLGRQARGAQLGRCVDSILVFSKTAGAPFRGEPPMRSTPVPLTRRGTPKGARWDPAKNAWFTTAPRGDYTDASMSQLAKEGRVHTSPSGTQYVKYFLRSGPDGAVYKDAPLDTLWDDEGVRPLRHASKRELAIRYVTQKPEGLLERIIRWASRPGDVVADFFAGSGTTLAVAHRMGRGWVGCDSGQLAVHTIRKRMLALDAGFEVLAAGTPTAGSALFRTSRGSLTIDDVRWLPLLEPKPLRVTRAKARKALVGVADPTSRIDLVVARPAAQGGVCRSGNRDNLPWSDEQPPAEVHIYDVAGRCAVALAEHGMPSVKSARPTPQEDSA